MGLDIDSLSGECGYDTGPVGGILLIEAWVLTTTNWLQRVSVDY